MAVGGNPVVTSKGSLGNEAVMSLNAVSMVADGGIHDPTVMMSSPLTSRLTSSWRVTVSKDVMLMVGFHLCLGRPEDGFFDWQSP